jgi:polar amino acid transport system substrate-binding protein
MIRRGTAALALVMALALAGGCVGGIAGTELKPKVAPPVVGEKGVLRAAVDLSYPPFAGTDKTTRAGLDIDVAAAVADRLGLTLKVVDATPERAAQLVKDKTVDVALGALTVDQAVTADIAFAGTYVSDAPAIFSAATTTGTVTVADLGGKRVAAQKDSYAYWILVDEYGEEFVSLMPTLRDAMAAVASGQADYAAGDAIVGSYLLRDFPKLRFAGQLAPAYPLGVGVSKANPELEAQVRRILDDLSAKGVLETLRGKWAGDLPRLDSPKSSSSSGTPVP